MLATMPRNKPLLRALKGDIVRPVPLWLMRQAGRYLPEYRAIRSTVGNFLDLCLTPELAAEITLQPIRRFGFDAAILFSDILTIPHALGQQVRFQEGLGPSLSPLDAKQDLLRLTCDDIEGRLDPVYRTLKIVSSKLPETTTLLGFAGAPWTVAAYMIEGKGSPGFPSARAFLRNRPEDMEDLIDLLCEATARHLMAQIAAGAEAVQIFDTWAGLLTEMEFHRWVIAPTQRIVRRIKKDFPDVPVIGFPKGAGSLYEGYSLETGIDAIGLDSSVSLDWAARVLQPKVTLQGNLDPTLLLANGDDLEQTIEHILMAVSSGPFVFNLGHGVLPETPLDAIYRTVDRIKSWKPT